MVMRLCRRRRRRSGSLFPFQSGHSAGQLLAQGLDEAGASRGAGGANRFGDEGARHDGGWFLIGGVFGGCGSCRGDGRGDMFVQLARKRRRRTLWLRRRRSGGGGAGGGPWRRGECEAGEQSLGVALWSFRFRRGRRLLSLLRGWREAEYGGAEDFDGAFEVRDACGAETGVR